jgi:DNA anti-recombination protein RmuC
MENMEENSKKIWKTCKKIEKRFGKFGRKIS